jgi:hypothetical protein
MEGTGEEALLSIGVDMGPPTQESLLGVGAAVLVIEVLVMDVCAVRTAYRCTSTAGPAAAIGKVQGAVSVAVCPCARGDVLSAIFGGSSAKGSNLMKGGGFLDLIEDERRRPPPTPADPAGEGPAKEDALFLAVIGDVVGVVDSALRATILLPWYCKC